MAEVDTGGGKKVSTKVDMTPMVDLAFLLITFFMLTTTMGKPSTMSVAMPDKDKDKTEKPPEVNSERTMTLILDKDNKIYWYQKVDNPTLEVVNYSSGSGGIRELLKRKKQEVEQKVGSKDPKKGLVVVIKLRDEASYKNMVDILDEMAVVDVPIYAIVDIQPGDIDLVENFKTGGNKPAEAEKK